MSENQDQDLVKRTIRTVAVLVGSCVLFVGALSVLAVLITGLAVGAGAKDPSVATPEKTDNAPTKTDKPTKRPSTTTPGQPAGNTPI